MTAAVWNGGAVLWLQIAVAVVVGVLSVVGLIAGSRALRHSKALEASQKAIEVAENTINLLKENLEAERGHFTASLATERERFDNEIARARARSDACQAETAAMREQLHDATLKIAELEAQRDLTPIAEALEQHDARANERHQALLEAIHALAQAIKQGDE